MAKRELSSTLRNLKFMQRGAVREEKSKKEEEVKPDGNFFSPGTIRKCWDLNLEPGFPLALAREVPLDQLVIGNLISVVIIEGDPHPGAAIGRMSFQSFNPSIDKMNEEAANPSQPEASATCSGDQSGRTFFRENGSSLDGECSNVDKLNSDANGDLKRKQSEVVSKPQYPNKSPKKVQDDQQSSPSNSRGSFKKPKQEKLDWSVLRPSKSKQKG